MGAVALSETLSDIDHLEVCAGVSEECAEECEQHDDLSDLLPWKTAWRAVAIWSHNAGRSRGRISPLSGVTLADGKDPENETRANHVGVTTTG